MQRFNKKAFAYALPIALTISISIAAVAITAQSAYSVRDISVGILLALIISAAASALIASYGLYLIAFVWAYRAVMRVLVIRALRSALSYAMTPVECSGILEIQETLALRVLAGESQGIQEGSKFNLYESTGDTYWGSVIVIDVRASDCDCVPYDRVNAAFWENLEDRMGYDTSKPSNVYLARDASDYETAMEHIIALLRHWR